jgi:hypothetical protein
MILRTIIISAIATTLMSLTGDKNTIEFKYPKRSDVKFKMTTNIFKKFKEEWRGEDYYYMCENGENKIICSVLFYKLNKDEQKLMVDPFEGMTNAGLPFIFFSDNSNLKKYEKNNVSWGEMTDDFMYRQNDILEFEGMSLKQKHMYAYTMFGKDIFVNIHLSKTNYTPKDSIAMRQILNDLKK